MEQSLVKEGQVRGRTHNVIMSSDDVVPVGDLHLVAQKMMPYMYLVIRFSLALGTIWFASGVSK